MASKHPSEPQTSTGFERSGSRPVVRSPFASGFAVATIAFVIAAVHGLSTTDTSQTLFGATLAAISAGFAHAMIGVVRRHC